MERAIRLALLLAGLIMLLLAVGYATRQPWVTALWPWPDGQPSFVFIGSSPPPAPPQSSGSARLANIVTGR